MNHEFDAGRDWRERFREQEAVSRYFFEKAMADTRRKSRKAALGLWAGPLVLALLAVLIWYWRGPAWALMGGGAAVAWSAVGAWKGLRLKPQSTGVAENGLEYLRGELVWQRTTLERALVWNLAPIALGIVLFVVMIAGKEGATAMKMMPFCLLCLAWLLAFIGLRWKQRRELARELKTLDTASDL
jgi:hypothetical protein